MNRACDKPDCRAAAIRDSARKAEQSKIAAARAIGEKWLARTAPDAARYELVVLAASGTTLVPPPVELRADLRSHLENLLAEEAPEQVDSDASPTVPRPGMAAACAACRGRCCNAGGSRAFIDARTVSRLLGSRPSGAALIQEYQNAVPDFHVANSCVFHGQDGCTLSRELRSETCNEFYCQPLRDWLIGAPDMRPGPTAIAVISDREVVRSAFVEDVETKS